MRCLAVLVLLLCSLARPGLADPRSDTLGLARLGWNYQLRSAMFRRDTTIPVHIHGRDLSGAALCIVGDPPDPQTKETLKAFGALLDRTYGKPLPMRFAGAEVRACGYGRRVVLRLYSGTPPHDALTRDLAWLDRVHALGLPKGRRYRATTPGMAQTFFGRRGAATHLLVQQGGEAPSDPLSRAYHRSILVEELFQSFTFGMDILKLDRQAPFLSKLEEIPLDLRRLPWGSDAFMAALLRSNPARLCPFDVLMLHAVAASPVDQTTDPAFLDWIDAAFDSLSDQAQATLSDARLAPVLDAACAPFVP